MTYQALQFNLILALFGAFFLFAHASLDYTHPHHFHPNPLPNPNARAILSIFRYDAAEITRARCIARPESCQQEARYDR